MQGSSMKDSTTAGLITIVVNTADGIATAGTNNCQKDQAAPNPGRPFLLFLQLDFIPRLSQKPPCSEPVPLHLFLLSLSKVSH